MNMTYSDHVEIHTINKNRYLSSIGSSPFVVSPSAYPDLRDYSNKHGGQTNV